ncbi:AAA family ATPase [Bdellovibrio bacteriovorus]|uniref:AAA family ATPase n=1 Tax=Bdellovibrio bacteriovorus TaxID=959 RepID=UPI0021D30F56|nr:AAA family ATPase [Bdellovibrio bacteriovorus]UXR65653.1 AAA family ATPase [Bdellovibrio bacteriovorus]
MKITQLKIIKSNLFGESLEIDLSDKMTCIMGGRGTGKTTILTLIKWCLTDDTLFAKNELNLIKSNLGSGVVEVTVESESQKYIFLKSWGDEFIVKDAQNNIVSDISNIFSGKLIDYFSSGSIEQIGTDPSQRMKIIDGAVGSRIDEINRNLTVLRAEIEKNQSEIFYSREEYKGINQEISQLSNVEAQLKEAQENLAKSTANEKEKEEFDSGLTMQKVRHLEASDLKSLGMYISELISKTASFHAFLQQHSSSLKTLKQSQNPQIDQQIKLIEGLVKSVSSATEQITQEANSFKNGLQLITREFSDRHQVEDLHFAEVRKKLESNRELFQKVAALTEAMTKLTLLKVKLNELIERGKALVEKRREYLDKLQQMYLEKTRNRISLAESLNQKIGKDIKIAVMPMGDKTAFENFIREMVSLGKMKITNEHLIWELSSPKEFLVALGENKIAEFAKQLNLSTERIEAISKVISLHDKKFELESIVCDDLINFYLKIDSSDDQSSYKQTEYLSLGQRCTTVLPILFSIANIPLIIDQPEDNLDNRFVAETIHRIIKETKEDRQLIFVTHNPNIPVVADSEHNVFINYNEGNSAIFNCGTVEDVKESIVSLLEGGRQAFTQRKICYGIED